jgi:hypothetical protein
MNILLGVVLLFAILCAAIAALQAVAINRVAPRTAWRGWLLGWWRFSEISQRAGQSAATQANIYKRAVIACLVFVVFGLVLSGWTINQRPAVTAALDHEILNGQRFDAAGLTDTSYLRPVAPMPGAISLES